MKEEKIIASLFEAARNEVPQRSFEEVSKNFSVGLQVSFWESPIEWLVNNIGLNTIIVISTTSLIGLGIFFGSKSEDAKFTTTAKATIVENISPKQAPIKEQITSTIPEVTKSTSPIKKHIPKDKKIITDPTTKNIVIDKPKPNHIEARETKTIIKPLTTTPVVNNESKDQTSTRKEKIITPKPASTPKTKINTTSQVEQVLQKSITIEVIDKALKEYIVDPNEALTIISNDNFSTDINLLFREKPVKIVNTIRDIEHDKVERFIYVASLQISNKKSKLQFFFDNTTVIVGLNKTAFGWESDFTSISRDNPQLNSYREILQLFLEAESIQEIFEKDNQGNYKPLVIITNGKFDKNIQLNHGGKMVKLIHEKDSPEYNPNEAFLDVKKFKLRRKKAIFDFNYKGYEVKLEFKKDNNLWSRTKSSVMINRNGN